MRQRLSLARVLLPDPPALLLDEPTSALDPVAARQVRDLLGRLARQQHRTVVICTHDLTEAEQLCDRVVVLEHGRVVADGSPATLAAQHGQAALRLDVDPAHRDRASDLVARLTGPTTLDETGRLIVPVTRHQVPELLRALLRHRRPRGTPTPRSRTSALHGQRPDATPHDVTDPAEARG